MTVSPGSTARASRTSSARTGTWSVALGRKTFGNMLRTPFDLPQVLAPGLAVPDLEVVPKPGDDDLAPDPSVLRERRGNHDSALLVRLRLGCPGEEVALHHACLPVERVEPGQAALDRTLPLRPRIAVEAPVHATREDDAPGKRFAKLGR